MKYFVVADVHGFYSEMMRALNEKEFDETNPEHKLIVCGDLTDRGTEALQMQKYILHLIELNKVVLVRGNHEDLVLEMLDNFNEYIRPCIDWTHHFRNGTFDTMLQLSGETYFDAAGAPDEFVAACRETPYIKKIIPQTVDFFETKHYIFVHGWIPCNADEIEPSYSFNPQWRNATPEAWEQARWFNGVRLAHYHDIKEIGKTIVCGHWHCSYGWSHIRQKRQEFPQKNRKDWQKSFEPYTEEGVIAIDACTAYSGIVNCIVIDD